MGDNKLLLRKQEELISEINDAISALKTLIELSPDSKSEELNEWQDAIVKLEDELLEIDDDRWYLVAEEDNSKIKIDFWEKYETNEVEEINENGYHLIKVSYTDSNDTKCICLINFKTNRELVKKCKDWEFVGTYIKILQSGYMIDKHNENRDVEYWSILNSDELEAINSIDFLDNHNIYLIDETELYDCQLEYIGSLTDLNKSEFADEYLKFKTAENRYGLLHKGKIIIEPEFYSIKEDESNGWFDFNVFKAVKMDKKTISILFFSEGRLMFQKDLVLDSLQVLEINFNYLLFYTKKGEYLAATFFDNTIKREEEFFFDNIFQLQFIGIDNIFCGVNKSDKKITIFIDSHSSDSDNSMSKFYYVIDGTDVKNCVASFLMSLISFNDLG